jgi:tRNA pseudouridine55 synthase
MIQMHGVLNILKPPGMTSHDVVVAARRILGIKRIGHTGTLDPAAAGVLPLCVGRAARLVEFLQGQDKVYRGEITLGIVTDTQDGTGKIIRETDDFAISREELIEASRRLQGPIEQLPPMTSAVRVKGERLYELARRGQEVARKPRQIHIYSWHFSPTQGSLTKNSRVMFDIHFSKGTYVRTAVHDLGELLGCGAHLSFLLRTRSGPFHLDTAVTLEELAKEREACLVPMDVSLDFPPLVLAPEEADRFIHGAVIPVVSESDGLTRIYGPQGFLGVGRIAGQGKTKHCRPIKVLVDP